MLTVEGGGVEFRYRRLVVVSEVFRHLECKEGEGMDIGVEYTVYSDDNFHFGDSKPVKHRVFADYEAAVIACKKIVDEFLGGALEEEPGIDAHDLLGKFAMFGDEPFISPAPDVDAFSARRYAAQRCSELCPE